MKHILLSLSCALAALIPATAQQQLKIGIIDMERLFGSYYRTQEIRKELETQDQTVQGEIERMRVELQQMLDRREELVTDAQAPELSPEVRDARREQVSSLQMEISSLERQVREYMQQQQNLMRESGSRAMRSIFDDLNSVISDTSRKEGYDLVFDKSGTSPQGVPFLLYSGDLADFTDLVVGEINQNAPEGFDPNAAWEASRGGNAAPAAGAAGAAPAEGEAAPAEGAESE